MSGSEDVLATVELKPLDAGQRLRSWEATEAWETFRGKVNRMSIGLPRWRRPTDGRSDRALTAMTVDLTLLPDAGCRFANAELAVRLDPEPGAGQAIVTRLEPAELADQAVVVQETSGGVKASLAALGGIAEAGVERSGTSRREVTRMLVRLAAFGTGTAEAGWRLTLTDARDIPLDTTGLTTTIAHPPGWHGTVWFSVVARIQVRSRTDRWLTAVFGPGDDARLQCSQHFPPRGTPTV